MWSTFDVVRQRLIYRHVCVLWLGMVAGRVVCFCVSSGEELRSGCCCPVLTGTAVPTGRVVWYFRENLITWCNLRERGHLGYA